MDDAATGGQSDLSSDPNKLVLCSALRPAQHVAAVAAWVSQSDWEVLMTNYNFESGGEDWPDAYRHSPISREESYGCGLVASRLAGTSVPVGQFSFVWLPIGSYKLQSVFTLCGSPGPPPSWMSCFNVV